MPQALNAPDAIRLTALSPCQDRGLGQAGLCVALVLGAHAHGKLRLRTARGLKASASVMAQCASTASRHARRGHQDRRKP